MRPMDCDSAPIVRIERILPGLPSLEVRLLYVGEPLGDPIVAWSSQFGPLSLDGDEWRNLVRERKLDIDRSTEPRRSAKRLLFEIDRKTNQSIVEFCFPDRLDLAASFAMSRRTQAILDECLELRFSRKERRPRAKGSIDAALGLLEDAIECVYATAPDPAIAAGEAFCMFARGDLRERLNVGARTWPVNEPDSAAAFFFGELAIQAVTVPSPTRRVAFWETLLPSLVRVGPYYLSRLKKIPDYLNDSDTPEDGLSPAELSRIEQAFKARGATVNDLEETFTDELHRFKGGYRAPRPIG